MVQQVNAKPATAPRTLEKFLAEWAEKNLSAEAMKVADWKGGIFPFCREQLKKLEKDLMGVLSGK